MFDRKTNKVEEKTTQRLTRCRLETKCYEHLVSNSVSQKATLQNENYIKGPDMVTLLTCFYFEKSQLSLTALLHVLYSLLTCSLVDIKPPQKISK